MYVCNCWWLSAFYNYIRRSVKHSHSALESAGKESGGRDHREHISYGMHRRLMKEVLWLISFKEAQGHRAQPCASWCLTGGVQKYAVSHSHIHSFFHTGTMHRITGKSFFSSLVLLWFEQQNFRLSTIWVVFLSVSHSVCIKQESGSAIYFIVTSFCNFSPQW